MCNGSNTFLGNPSCHLSAEPKKQKTKNKIRVLRTTLEVLRGFFATTSIPRELNDPRGRDDGPMTRLYSVEGYAWHIYTG